MRNRKKTQARQPVSRERAVRVAVELADAGGLEQLTMRRIAEALGVEAMSLYHHFANKDAILDGMVDVVFAEIGLPDKAAAWQDAMRKRAASVRGTLLRHRWAISVMESRTTPGPATLAHHDAVLGCLRGAGFSIPQTGHAYAVLDSYIYGFIHTELNLPFETSQETHEVAQSIFSGMPEGMYPHLVEFTLQHVLRPGYEYANEFSIGLELIIEGLERARQKERKAQKR